VISLHRGGAHRAGRMAIAKASAWLFVPGGKVSQKLAQFGQAAAFVISAFQKPDQLLQYDTANLDGVGGMLAKLAVIKRAFEVMTQFGNWNRDGLRGFQTE
jgi:hypothetical protein